MIQVKDGNIYVLESYKNGVRFYPKDTKSIRKNYISREQLKTVYEKVRAEGNIKLNIPPDKRSWLPALTKKKPLLYEIARILRSLFWDWFFIEEGMLKNRVDLNPFDVEYPKACQILFSRNPNDILDITHTRNEQDVSCQVESQTTF